MLIYYAVIRDETTSTIETINALRVIGHTVVTPTQDDAEPDLLVRCDAIVIPVIPSPISRAAEVYAQEYNIPVYQSPELPTMHQTELNTPKQVKAFIAILMRLYRVHLDKNADYSPANILGAGEIGLITRLWDKTARLMNLSGFRIELVQPATYTKPHAPKNESIEDTYLDLTTYGIIGLLLRRGVWGK